MLYPQAMSKNSDAEFHPLSQAYQDETTLLHRKKFGQYFTPKTIREQLLSYFPKDISSPKILDPSCGTGEFLLSASTIWADGSLYGWEIDSKLVEIANKVIPQAEIIRKDSLKSMTTEKFDFIVGNPPYFEMKLSDNQKNQYRDILGGRMNIFSLFIKISLDMLKKNGYLGFVIPPSMNNGAYFANLRKYIIAHADIVNLEIISSPSIFSNAQQQVMILILKKQKSTEKYLFSKSGVTIFSPDREKLQHAFKGKSTLFESGFSVKTGSIVWNKEKDKLTDSPKNGKLLIWSGNIEKEKLTLHNLKKPQYIISEKAESGPVILVNRITGTSNRPKIKAVFIGESTRFLAENHVNIIYPPDQINGKKLTISLLKSLAKQISSTESGEIIRLISGNTQLSKTELWKLLPLTFTD